MKNVIAGELHVVVAERQDHVTGVFWTRHPQQHLCNLASATQLGRIEIRPASGAIAIVEALSRRLDVAPGLRSESTFWTHADFETVIATLAEYSDIGARISNAEIGINDPVYVPALGRGVVTGVTSCGRLAVKLDRPVGDTVAVIAPRSRVKPILRPAARR